MELSVREWMIIIGALLIVAVLLDGYRRVRNENRHRIKVSLSRQAYRQARTSPPVIVDSGNSGPNPELPNGGARVIPKGKSSLQLDQSVPVLLESVDIPPQPVEAYAEPPSLTTAPEADQPEADDVASSDELYAEGDDDRYDEPVVAPVWDRGEEAVPEAEPVTAQQDESLPVPDADESAEPDQRRDEWSPLPVATPVDASDDEPVDEWQAPAAAPFIDEPVPVAAEQASLHQKRVGAWEDDPWFADTDADEPDAAEPSERRSPWHGFSFRRRDESEQVAASSNLDNAPAREVLAIYVVARNGVPFKGQDLLQLLLACDLRFGKMNIFHRHEQPNGRGAVQFSVANIAEPGTFDLDRIEEFSTQGVCLFLTLPGPEAPYKAFDYMVETAQVLVKHLDAELRDDAHSALTRQTLEHCRQRIRDFERKQLTLHL